MDEYIYAGKGWVPEVGDVCETGDGNDRWVECQIVPITLPDSLDPTCDYIVHIPGERSSSESGNWSVEKCDLRKRINPDNKEIAEQEWITDLKSLLNREGVTA